MVKRTFCIWIKRSFGIAILTGFFLTLSAVPVLCANVIVDHTNWDWYNSQPQPVVDRVALLKIFFAHASVGGNIMDGFSALHTANASTYPLNQSGTGDTPPDTTSNSTIYDFNRGNPGWSDKVSGFTGYINNGWHATAVDVAMNKFCYIDQAADWTTYRDSMLALEAAYPTTKFIYWTMPITTASDADEILRAQFNQNLRNWIATQNNKILFDIADIQAWKPGGVQQTFTSGEQTYQHMYSGYSSDGGHLNATGGERVATGLYSLFGLITDNALYASFTGYGLYKYNGTDWTRINTIIPDNMAASSGKLYASFTGYGLYKYDGTTWTYLNIRSSSMAATASVLYASFTGYGLYKYDGSAWTQINWVVALSVAASGTDLYASFTGYGTYKYDGSVWTQINWAVADSMTASGTNLYANFAGYGLYKYDGTWARLNIAADIIAVSGTVLYASFIGYGTYKYDGTDWTKLNWAVADSMTASGTSLYADFNGYGLYKYDGTDWSYINIDAVSIVGAK